MPRPTEPPLEKPPDHPIVLFQAADGQVCLDGGCRLCLSLKLKEASVKS